MVCSNIFFRVLRRHINPSFQILNFALFLSPGNIISYLFVIKPCLFSNKRDSYAFFALSDNSCNYVKWRFSFFPGGGPFCRAFLPGFTSCGFGFTFLRCTAQRLTATLPCKINPFRLKMFSRKSQSGSVISLNWVKIRTFSLLSYIPHLFCIHSPIFYYMITAR